VKLPTIFLLALIGPVVAQVTDAQAQPADSLRTTSLWQFRPDQVIGTGHKGFGMIPLFADASQSQIGAINFYCVVTGGHPYLDIYAYKGELTISGDERRWPVLTAQTILHFENSSIPVSIEGAFIFVDVNSRTELSLRQIFNVARDQPSERILEVPGFVKLKLAFQPALESSNEADGISVSFDEMLALCKAAKKSVPPHSNVPRR
jgi:hypothetical protein